MRRRRRRRRKSSSFDNDAMYAACVTLAIRSSVHARVLAAKEEKNWCSTLFALETRASSKCVTASRAARVRDPLAFGATEAAHASGELPRRHDVARHVRRAPRGRARASRDADRALRPRFLRHERIFAARVRGLGGVRSARVAPERARARVPTRAAVRDAAVVARTTRARTRITKPWRSTRRRPSSIATSSVCVSSPNQQRARFDAGRDDRVSPPAAFRPARAPHARDSAATIRRRASRFTSPRDPSRATHSRDSPRLT